MYVAAQLSAWFGFWHLHYYNAHARCQGTRDSFRREVENHQFKLIQRQGCWKSSGSCIIDWQTDFRGVWLWVAGRSHWCVSVIFLLKGGARGPSTRQIVSVLIIEVSWTCLIGGIVCKIPETGIMNWNVCKFQFLLLWRANTHLDFLASSASFF